jgi:hypothetical protein
MSYRRLSRHARSPPLNKYATFVAAALLASQLREVPGFNSECFAPRPEAQCVPPEHMEVEPGGSNRPVGGFQYQTTYLTTGTANR